MKKIIIVFCLLVPSIVLSQNITNTLGASGVFSVKDGSTTFLTLDQTNGYLNLTSGVILKGTERFIHSYQAPGSYGNNIFVGWYSGNFTMSGTGSQSSGNTALGYASMYSLTTGSYNTASGYYSLYANTAGNGNTALGYNSLSRNSTGSMNTAIGTNSFSSNITGIENVAMGFNSLVLNSTGNENTGIGTNSLRFNIAGFQNTAIGHHSLQNNKGNYNTALGYNAGSNVTTGANLTLIGIDANPSAPTAVDEITLGNTFVTSLRCNAITITSLSDKRDKKNITDLTLGLDFITKLKPRQYNWDRRDWYENGISDGSKMRGTPTAGFVAQELDSLQSAENAEWLDLVLKNNPEKWEATPGNLFPIVVKAIQELKKEKDELQIENDQVIAKLVQENKNLRNRIEKFEETQLLLVKKLKEIESNSGKTNTLFTEAIKEN